MAEEQLGRNIKASLDGSVLTIKINLAEQGIPSGSGKSMVIATTSGNQPIPGREDIKIGINCYRKLGR